MLTDPYLVLLMGVTTAPFIEQFTPIEVLNQTGHL